MLLDLGTLPKYGRQGCGAQLVQWGLDRADREGKTAVLSASPQGFGLYKKLGYKEVDRCNIQLGEYGGEGEHEHGRHNQEDEMNDECVVIVLMVR